MAFSYTVKSTTVFGDKVVKLGTFTNTSGSTGGDIVTGLSNSYLFVQAGGGTADKAASVNETVPLDDGSFTIVTDADIDGSWVAIGDRGM